MFSGRTASTHWSPGPTRAVGLAPTTPIPVSTATPPAAGAWARIAVLEPGELHLPEPLGEPPSDRGAVELPEPEAVSDVGARGHVGPERVVLEDHADVTLVGSQLVHAALAEPDLAGVGCPKARDEAEQRRLAAAGRPEQCEELAVGDLERNPVDGGHAVEALRDTAQRDVHWTGVRETGLA